MNISLVILSGGEAGVKDRTPAGSFDNLIGNDFGPFVAGALGGCAAGSRFFVRSLGRLRPAQDDNVYGRWVCDFLVEVVRDGFRFRDEQRQHALGFD